MAVGYKITGLDECLRSLDQAPQNLLKMTKTAMRAAARSSVKSVKGKVPSRWKELVTSRVKQLSSGEIYAGMGLYNRSEVSGHQPGAGKDPVFDWYKAYWANYGTLDRRDSSHTFSSPVKKRSTKAAKNRRNTQGQPAQKFFEGAIAGWEDVFIAAFEKSIQKQKDKIYGK